MEKTFPFPIPVWVRWAAQESSGAWWGYTVEPLRHESGWYENEVGRCVYLGVTRPDGWEQSLRPLREHAVEGGQAGCQP